MAVPRKSAPQGTIRAHMRKFRKLRTTRDSAPAPVARPTLEPIPKWGAEQGIDQLNEIHARANRSR